MKEKLPRFSRFIKIIGEDNFDKLRSKCVLVLGCGGVGGYVIEALARSGIGKLVIVDYDVIDETNINRQIIATSSTIGMKKVDVLESRIKDINPSCQVIKIDKKIVEDNISILFNNKVDYFVDACDTVSIKLRIIDECLSRKIKFVSSMGTGNKLDPTKLQIIDIRKTQNDPLARIVRKYVKDNNIKSKIMVLSSSELPINTVDKSLGSSAFVPSSAGILIASYVVKKLINKN